MAFTVGAASTSWLPKNIGLMPKIIVTPSLSTNPHFPDCLSGFPDRLLSGCHRFLTGHPDLRVDEVTAIGGTRATGWSLVTFQLVHATFECLIKLNRRNRWFWAQEECCFR
jgi:hypothetical protein